MLGCTEKKYVPINSIQRCLGIYYLFYDIFVMNVIHRTINNNKTGRVFVFFQKGHAIFQLVFGDFIIIFFLHSLLLLAFTLISELDTKNVNLLWIQAICKVNLIFILLSQQISLLIKQYEIVDTNRTLLWYNASKWTAICQLPLVKGSTLTLLLQIFQKKEEK